MVACLAVSTMPLYLSIANRFVLSCSCWLLIQQKTSNENIMSKLLPTHGCQIKEYLIEDRVNCRSTKAVPKTLQYLGREIYIASSLLRNCWEEEKTEALSKFSTASKVGNKCYVQKCWKWFKKETMWRNAIGLEYSDPLPALINENDSPRSPLWFRICSDEVLPDFSV